MIAYFVSTAVIMVVGLVVAQLMSGKKRARLSALAAAHGWVYAKTSRELPGQPSAREFGSGIPAAVGTPRDIMMGRRGNDTFFAFTAGTQGDSSSRPEYGVVKLHLSAVLPGITLTREGVGTSIAKFFGGQDLQIGEPYFDAAYRIQADDPVYAQTLLNHDVRAWFMAPGRWNHFTISGNIMMIWREYGLEYETLPWVLADLEDLLGRIGPDVWGAWSHRL